MILNLLYAIRVKFLLASVIAVINGLSIAVWRYKELNYLYAFLTFAGVICLHASIDLFNDYWDYKRGIDTNTKRTAFSGGSGVLPRNLLKPNTVYIAAIILLLIGSIIGFYFVLVRGIVIVVLLGFAIFSIYFYSNSIVNIGLGEVFVAIKGSMIVLGTLYVQVSSIDVLAYYIGATIGILSASVLFVNSFPDYNADRYKGRRTLVILIGKKRSAKIFPIIITCTYFLIIMGILLGYTKIYSLLCLSSIPFAIRGSIQLKRHYDEPEKLIPAMGAIVAYSRVTGILLAISLLL
jgi:1,4-dihydroxy-2-naphthoate polyprenyltransferase